MSKSYHTTRRDLEVKSKKEIDELADDPDSILDELAEKRVVNEKTITSRKTNGSKSNEL